MVIELQIPSDTCHRLALLYVGVPQDCHVLPPQFKRRPFLDLAIQQRLAAGVHVARAQHWELCRIDEG